MKVLIDMNLSPRWAETLSHAGIDATHWSKLGPSNARDVQIMAYARSGDWIVLTHDLDFGTILAATQGHKPSVVQIRADDVSPDAIGPQLIAASHQMATDLANGALLTVDPKRTRMRVLPLRSRE